MSTTTQPRLSVDERECDREDCEETYRAARGTQGYCSERCWSRATARSLLTGVHRDHQFCASCFRKLRTVTPPPPDWYFGGDQEIVQDVVCGWAIPEAHCVEGDVEVLTQSTIPGAGLEATDQTTRRQICSCGTTHHTTIERSTLTKAETRHHATRLFEALADRHDRGCHDYDLELAPLRSAALTLKSREELTNHDGLVFRHAIAVALRCSTE